MLRGSPLEAVVGETSETRRCAVYYTYLCPNAKRRNKVEGLDKLAARRGKLSEAGLNITRGLRELWTVWSEMSSIQPNEGVETYRISSDLQDRLFERQGV